MRDPLAAVFLNHAAEILADTARGLSGSEIVRATTAYAVDANIEIPHARYPFEAPNKRTALADNLMVFPETLRYRIIRELCDHPSIQSRNKEGAQRLKLQLMVRYGHLAPEPLGDDVNDALVRQTRHWLDSFPEVLSVYNQALEKYQHGVFTRNLLDDLRLSLEKLLQKLLGNKRSLENQLGNLGGFIRERGGSAELINMFVKLIDYYCKYQNTYIKHDDAVLEEEVEFIIEITSSFMKHFVRLSTRDVI